MINFIEKSYLPVTADLAFFNTKIKYYGDDYVKVSCFSRNIFNPYKLEKHKNSYTLEKERIKQENFENIKYLTGFTKIENKDIGFDIESLFLKNDSPSQYDIENFMNGLKEYRKRKNNLTRSDSIKRSRDKVYDIAYSNDFDYFITLTLDASKISRTDTTEILKKLNVWCNNMVKRRNFKYVLCPEYHADGESIHFHGLCSGDNLDMIDSGKLFKGNPVYNIANWGYGFTTCLKLDKNKEFICKYITKYITKDNIPIFGRYYFSGGNICREVRTEYANLDYLSLDSDKEYQILEHYLSVKYKTL